MATTTSEFLGTLRQWSEVSIDLDDVQALYGGFRLQIRRGQAFITKNRTQNQKDKYWLLLNTAETQLIRDLLLEHDFLTIAPEERPGLPDEARPTITVTNATGESHRVAKWVGIRDDRFDPIYNALLAITYKIENRKPLNYAEPRWWTIARFLSIGLFAIAIGGGARIVAQTLLTPTDTTSPASLALPILLLTGAVALFLLGITMAEWFTTRQKGFFSRSVSLFIVLIANLYVISLVVVIPFFVEVSLTHWGEPTTAIVEGKFTSVSYDPNPGVTHINHSFRYRYTPSNGTSYTGRVDVKPAYYESTQKGDAITVYYFTRFPRWSVIEAEKSAHSRAAFLVTVMLTLLGWLCGIGLVAYILVPMSHARDR